MINASGVKFACATAARKDNSQAKGGFLDSSNQRNR